MYDVYEVPFYHNGVVVFKDGKCVGFKSEGTGRTYPLKRWEPETFLHINDLFNSGDLAIDGNHYVEDVTIVHEISGDVVQDFDGETCEVAEQHFDGKPISDYKLTADFMMAIDEVIYQEFMQAGE
jgi:hypothetical protein